MSIVGAFMVPHPPLAVKEVGKGSEEKIKLTIDSYLEVAKEIGELNPDTIVISSPHAPLYSDCFFMPEESILEGSFMRFGAGSVSFKEEVDTDLIDEIENISNNINFPAYKMEMKNGLDHGTMVPLYFIRKYLSKFKIVVIGLSDISLDANYKMGTIIKKAIDNLDRRVVYVASGDLSHKLQEYGPYGFVKEGPIYDEKIIDVMKDAKFEELLKFDEDLLVKAAECGHRSFIMMSGALEGVKVKPRFYSHQDITGVGYGICSYYPADPYVELATRSINSYVRDKKVLEIDDSVPNELTGRKGAVFVSIHKHGDLRGCIGTILPTKSSIAKEIIDNAISASTRDPRFNPVTVDELNDLEINVDVLTIPEDIDSKDMLDPRTYGVIVTSGFKRGLLLPDLEGVDTVDEQIAISKRKAGITDNEEISLQRFKVIRHK